MKTSQKNILIGVLSVLVIVLVVIFNLQSFAAVKWCVNDGAGREDFVAEGVNAEAKAKIEATRRGGNWSAAVCSDAASAGPSSQTNR